ncbi:hypothetical protein K144313037_p20440 (plasmid) [Clostridium tetani]|uniref:hypothetical protein n=1 Tax=Clostridium tetani TaxID=1513 RepID=UPI00295471CF|nr:hypothetical protein [Clostridium tetani]BDR71257.1 hypothetical protein K144313037_p20440 [Clostridium tetani]BEV19058.1 hypothetical protein K154301001_09130 [Clostridium tetani]
MNRALEVLISAINAEIDTLNKHDFKIYDEENPTYYIAGIYYDKETDKIYCRFKEEK